MNKTKEKKVEEVVEEVEVVEETASEKKQAFKQLIADYKEQNPAKYKAKKERLEAKLKSL